MKMGKINESDMEKFGTLDSSEKTIAILGDRWWPPTAKQEEAKTCKRLLCTILYATYGKKT